MDIAQTPPGLTMLIFQEFNLAVLKASYTQRIEASLC